MLIIQKLGPDMCPVLVFRLNGKVIRIVRCKNVNGELIPIEGKEK